MYGGCSGQEHSLNQCNPAVNKTILSGDIAGNDISDMTNPAYASYKTDNAWHVVTIGDDVNKTGKTVTLNGLTITDGYAAGPDFVDGNGNLIYSHESGGGLYARFGSVVNIQNVIFQNNAAAYNPQRSSSFVPGGGAIAALDTGTQLNISSSSFQQNQSGDATTPNSKGGAIYLVNGASGNMNSILMKNNSSMGDGGGIEIANTTDLNGTLNITNSQFLGNKVVGDFWNLGNGGGVQFFNANGSVKNSQFDSNTVTYSSSALGIQFGGLATTTPPTQNIVIDNCSFTRSNGYEGTITVTSQGYANPNDLVVISNSLFDHNHITTDGGGVDIDSININFVNDRFTNNTADGNGGAVHSDDFFASLLSTPFSTTNITNSYFENNVSNGNVLPFISFLQQALGADGIAIGQLPGGGGLAVGWNATAKTDSNIFINNAANNGNGGAILNGGLTFTVPACLPSLTSPPLCGFDDGATVSVNNDLLVGNSAVNGGGIASESIFPMNSSSYTQPVIMNVSNTQLFNNKASASGGGIYSIHTTATLNKLVYLLNIAPADPNLYVSDSILNGKTTP